MWFIGFAEGDGCFHTDEEDTDSGSFLAKQRKAYYIIECKIDLVLVACNVLLCVHCPSSSQSGRSEVTKEAAMRLEEKQRAASYGFACESFSLNPLSSIKKKCEAPFLFLFIFDKEEVLMHPLSSIKKKCCKEALCQAFAAFRSIEVSQGIKSSD